MDCIVMFIVLSMEYSELANWGFISLLELAGQAAGYIQKRATDPGNFTIPS